MILISTLYLENLFQCLYPVPLSRAFLNATDTNEQKFEYQVHMVLDNLPVSKEKLDEIKQATRSDYVL